MDPTTRPYLGVVEAIEMLPDGDPLLRREPHRIARPNAEDVEERVGIAQRLCPAHHIRRVRVGADELFQGSRADLDAPGGRGGDEEALLWRKRRLETADRGRSRLARCGHGPFQLAQPG